MPPVNPPPDLEAARSLVARYNPADPATWTSAASVRAGEAEAQALQESDSLVLAGMGGEGDGRAVERVRQYTQARDWLQANPRFVREDSSAWVLPTHEARRADRLKEAMAELRLSSPALWIVPAEHALAYQEFMRVDLSDYRTYADDRTVAYLDELTDTLGVEEATLEGEIARLRTEYVRAMQATHLTLWQAAVAHREEMMCEYSQLCSKAQRAFLDKQRAMSATIADLEAEHLDAMQERIQNKLMGLADDARQAYTDFEEACEAVASVEEREEPAQANSEAPGMAL